MSSIQTCVSFANVTFSLDDRCVCIYHFTTVLFGKSHLPWRNTLSTCVLVERNHKTVVLYTTKERTIILYLRHDIYKNEHWRRRGVPLHFPSPFLLQRIVTSENRQTIPTVYGLFSFSCVVVVAHLLQYSNTSVFAKQRKKVDAPNATILLNGCVFGCLFVCLLCFFLATQNNPNFPFSWQLQRKWLPQSLHA